MGMTKDIVIDDKPVRFRASAAIPRIYRIKFGRDIYRDLASLEKATKKGDKKVFAGTFHSFCCKILRQDGHHLGIDPKFVIYDTNDKEDLIKMSLIDLNLNPKEFKPASIMYFIEAAKNSFQTPKDMIAQSHGFWQDYAAKGNLV